MLDGFLKSILSKSLQMLVRPDSSADFRKIAAGTFIELILKLRFLTSRSGTQAGTLFSPV